MKKIIAITCCLFSGLVFAMPNQEINKMSSPVSWCVGHDLPNYESCPSVMGFHPPQPATIVLYVKRNIANSNKPSDPIRFDCNGVPSYVNPGSSYVCEIPADGIASWEIENRYLRNGSDGVVISVEGFEYPG